MEKKTKDKSPENKKAKLTSDANLKKRSFPICFVWQSLLAILVITALLGAAYVFTEQKKLVTANSGLRNNINNKLNEITESHQVYSQKLNVIEAQLSQQQQQLDHTKQSLERLLLEQPRQSKDWVVREIDHMLRLAQLNLNYNRNVNAALSLLEAADTKLKLLNDPSLNQLRQSFALDLNQLRDVPKVDKAGVLAKLSALNHQITQLPLQSTNTKANETTETKNEKVSDNKKSKWQQGLQKSMEALEKIVVIRRIDQPIKPMLLPEQRVAIEQNLQLLLQQAQWAVLQSDSALYVSSLQQTTDWVKRYFDPNAEISKNVLSTLTQLKNIDIKPQIPDLTNSLEALQLVISKHYEKHLTKPKQKSEKSVSKRKL